MFQLRSNKLDKEIDLGIENLNQRNVKYFEVQEARLSI